MTTILHTTVSSDIRGMTEDLAFSFIIKITSLSARRVVHDTSGDPVLAAVFAVVRVGVRDALSSPSA